MLPTVTPHVTLMGELPVVDAFQSHPFNGHLQREIETYRSVIRLDLILSSINPAFGTYWEPDSVSNCRFALLNITQVL